MGRTWLDGGDLVHQRWLIRRRIALATATFALTETSWTVRRRVISAPALLVRAQHGRRIVVPLAARSGHAIVDNRVLVAWRPDRDLHALAHAIERHATAPDRRWLVAFLRGLGRASVRPSATLDAPF